MHVLSIFGTRPEAIKMAPLVKALSAEPQLQSTVCITGQHREMLEQVMSLFSLKADHDLSIMVPNQTLNGLFSRMMSSVDALLDQVRPDCVLVHGDTTTAAAAALAAFHRRIPVGHVEAGLRSGDIHQPFPEEMNRRLVDSVSRWMFAPTETSRAALLREQVSGQVWVTGNTVIDALKETVAKLQSSSSLQSEFRDRYSWVDDSARLILVTGHRRENFGDGLQNICAALKLLAQKSQVQIVYPVHLNPNVRDVVMTELKGIENIHLIPPVDYLDFVWLMNRAHIVLTDSGGVQEEAPFLGKPVLVMRDITERPEAVAAGAVRLVGTSQERIAQEAASLLDDATLYADLSRIGSPYGDGAASRRIVDVLCGRTVDEFQPKSF